MEDRHGILLSAGVGSRLQPFTQEWPKCLMPINAEPLLSKWLSKLEVANIKSADINTHWLAEIVQNFVSAYDGPVSLNSHFEEILLGTAGTLRKISEAKLIDNPVLVAHADNYTNLDLDTLFNFHSSHLQPITMTVFQTKQPERCGVVLTNDEGIVLDFHEKRSKPCSNIANAAVYIFDPEIFTFLQNDPSIMDISNDLIPHYLGEIKTFRHDGFLIDIGTSESLIEAQLMDNKPDAITRSRFSDSLISMKFDKICEDIKCLAGC